MSNVFNVTRLAGARALVQGTDEGESTILFTMEYDELKGNTALKEAEADFDTLLDILDEASQAWAADEVPFWAFIALPDEEFPDLQ